MTTPTAPDSKVKAVIAPALGVLVLALFGVFIVYLLGHLSLDETSWSRAIYLFGGVEAVAFAAAGYFFGTQVQRGKVEEAKKDSEASKQVAAAAGEQAKSERRASRQLARGIVDAAAPRSRGLLGDPAAQTASIDPVLVAQAQALLDD